MRVTLAIILFSNCNQPKPPESQTDQQSEQQAGLGFYKRFEGTIAGNQIIMHLHKTETHYTGSYYYRNTGEWINVSAGNLSSDSIILNEYAEAYNENAYDETNQPQLRCRLQNDQLTGVWMSADKKTSYPIDLKETYPTGTYKFFIKNYIDSITGFPGMKGKSPAAEIEYSFVSAVKNNWLNNEIKKIMGYDSSLNFKDGFQKIKNDYFNFYKKDLPADFDSLEMPDTYNFSQSQNVTIRYNENDFVIFESSEYSYSGGMHGNYSSTFFGFDIPMNKSILLADIVSADSVSLQKVVEKYFRIQYKVKSDSLNEILFENYLPANKNFYFNEKGITFLYNPYEVASYAQGEISVFIPFAALKNYLQPAFQKRITIIL